VYANAESAAAALAAYEDDYLDGWGSAQVGEGRLGDGGLIFEGLNQLDSAPQVVYVWRADQYVLHVLATGSVEADAGEIRAIAQGMQARADASVTARRWASSPLHGPGRKAHRPGAKPEHS
jgi:hypothetical protein